MGRFGSSNIFFFSLFASGKALAKKKKCCPLIILGYQIHSSFYFYFCMICILISFANFKFVFGFTLDLNDICLLVLF